MPGSRTRTAAWRAVGNFVVFVHTKSSPTDAEWDQILGLFRNLPEIRKVRVLVYTQGGAPDPKQRAKLSQLLSMIKPPVAVLTPSPLARAAGVAISWFLPSLRVFDADGLDAALDHLDAPEAERIGLKSALVELRRELGV